MNQTTPNFIPSLTLVRILSSKSLSVWGTNHTISPIIKALICVLKIFKIKNNTRLSMKNEINRWLQLIKWFYLIFSNISENPPKISNCNTSLASLVGYIDLTNKTQPCLSNMDVFCLACFNNKLFLNFYRTTTKLN